LKKQQEYERKWQELLKVSQNSAAIYETEIANEAAPIQKKLQDEFQSTMIRLSKQHDAIDDEIMNVRRKVVSLKQQQQ